MKPLLRYLTLSLLAGFLFASASHAAAPPKQHENNNAVQGRWDIVIQKDGKELPSWLEVYHSGTKTLIGRFVYAFGSARPIAEVVNQNGSYHFAIPPQWEPGDKDMKFDFTLKDDRLAGTMVYTDGKTYNWTGVRAPSLNRDKAVVWGKPEKLFNGKNMDGWHTMGPNQWLTENGVLRSPHSGSNLVTDKKFTDFKLHIEFRYPKGSNSGVYLRGRYEVQVEDSKGFEPQVDLFSAIYGFLPPNKMMAKSAGEWQPFDITLVGRTVTVVANGKTVISEQVIPGITGGALDSREGEPGPIYIQGDHGPVEYRNIVITPAL
ncbi:MAG: hypothetical protein B7Y76_05655 [Sphingobacteriia bacterium 35-40-5]|nr:MAG: hypothetical protein B7Y76_05655 [Sphingobacteriia bacterium 35-40-5]